MDISIISQMIIFRFIKLIFNYNIFNDYNIRSYNNEDESFINSYYNHFFSLKKDQKTENCQFHLTKTDFYSEKEKENFEYSYKTKYRCCGFDECLHIFDQYINDKNKVIDEQSVFNFLEINLNRSLEKIFSALDIYYSGSYYLSSFTNYFLPYNLQRLSIYILINKELKKYYDNNIKDCFKRIRNIICYRCYNIEYIKSYLIKIFYEEIKFQYTQGFEDFTLEINEKFDLSLFLTNYYKEINDYLPVKTNFIRKKNSLLKAQINKKEYLVGFRNDELVFLALKPLEKKIKHQSDKLPKNIDFIDFSDKDENENLYNLLKMDIYYIESLENFKNHENICYLSFISEEKIYLKNGNQLIYEIELYHKKNESKKITDGKRINKIKLLNYEYKKKPTAFEIKTVKKNKKLELIKVLPFLLLIILGIIMKYK